MYRAREHGVCAMASTILRVPVRDARETLRKIERGSLGSQDRSRRPPDKEQSVSLFQQRAVSSLNVDPERWRDQGEGEPSRFRPGRDARFPRTQHGFGVLFAQQERGAGNVARLPEILRQRRSDRGLDRGAGKGRQPHAASCGGASRGHPAHSERIRAAASSVISLRAAQASIAFG